MPTQKKNTKKKKWIAGVTTDSTHSPPDCLPKVPASSAIHKVRQHRGLSAKRKAELERAKSMLSDRIKRTKKSKNTGS